jgi:peptide/nickel transport system permease protein
MEAARLGELSKLRLVSRHLLPGLVPSTLVLASLDVGGLVLTLAGLSFLGLGAPAPQPELGAMSAQGTPYLMTAWWVAVFPGLGVLLLALVSNLAGDAVRDLTGTGS